MKYFSRVSILFISFLLLACSPQQEEGTTPYHAVDGIEMTEAATETTSCELTMGFDAWDPYQYVGVGNVVTGLDIEIVRAVAQTMDCTINTKQATWVELLHGVRSGEIDFVLGASYTGDRAEYAYFSEPYREEQFILYVRRHERPMQYDSIEEFLAAGHRLGIVNDYFYGDEITPLYNDPKYQDQFVGAIISEMNMARLVDEDIDGFLEDSFVGASILRRKGFDAFIEPHGIRLDSSPVYVMFSQSTVSEAQVEAFNKGLAKIKESGKYQEIIGKYDL